MTEGSATVADADPLVQAIRGYAKKLGFESTTRSAVQARKHQRDLPAHLQSESDPIGVYFTALEQALAHGTAFPPERNYGGGSSTRVVFHHAFPSPYGEPPEILEAVVYHLADGRALVAGFGEPYAKPVTPSPTSRAGAR